MKFGLYKCHHGPRCIIVVSIKLVNFWIYWNFIFQLTQGKADFSVPLEELKGLIPRPYYYTPEQKWEARLEYQSFVINATVIDDLTSLMYNEEAPVTFRQSLYSVKSVSAAANYKIGVPYFATVSTKILDCYSCVFLQNTL